MNTEQQDHLLARKARVIALIIAGTIVFWIVAQLIAKQVGLPGRYAFLFDFAAIAALIWALVNIYQIWRARQTNEG
ncbi:DUF5337 domain-containing protein [Pseudopelagicola sp. nBUS_19]|uniref:DUF5337 domain-containing protein n=1 Tax=unclassified Pseudopelagicola TaxID=2649563 RepID=UPI003EBF7A34